MTARRPLPVLLAALAMLCLSAPALVPPAARADADPASDFLLVTPVFYPYANEAPTSPALKKTLESTLAALKAKGLNLKVAIVLTDTDLGGVSNLFNQPQTYATFLDREISFNTHQALLVVMPAGFGVANAGPAGLLNGLVVDSSHQANGLARSAILATLRIARANGRAIPTPVIPAATSSGTGKGKGTSPLLEFGAPVALVVLAAAVAALLRRRQPPDDEEAGA